MNVTVGLAQMQPKIGDVTANLQTHFDYIDAARKQNVDLLIFPELSLTGYNLEDLVFEIAAQPTEEDAAFFFGRDADRMHMLFNFHVNQHLFYALASADSRPLAKALTATKPRPATAHRPKVR